MNRNLHILGTWLSRLVLAGMGLFGPALLAQAPDSSDTPTASSAQQQTNPKPAPAAQKKEGEWPQPQLGVAVDSARKSDVLATWITTEHNPGETTETYTIKQSGEFGGRITSYTGNPGTWDSMVNLGTGPRLLEYSLQMHSPTHTGKLFDDLLFTNFGYGGDPNNVSRIRMQKGRAYSFNASFRRDQNVFDYNLFANPLNPFFSSPSIQITNSPHEFLLTRRMSDANLTLFPVGKIRVKLSWSRVVNEGTSFSSDHQGTETLVQQPVSNSTDVYNFEVSARVIPRTSLNYNQFFTFYKGDTYGFMPGASTNFLLAGVPFFTLAGGTPVNAGLPFNTPANQPCAFPVVLASGALSPTCSSFLGYSRNGKNRNTFPTEQFSFQSDYWKFLDLSGRLNYTDAEANTPSTSELFNGLSRNRLRASNLTGSALANRTSLSGDLAATFFVTNKFRIVDQFRYNSFRIPGSWSLVTANFFAANLLINPNIFSAATCPPPFTAATCPQHLSGSSADVIVDNRNDLLRQDLTSNAIYLEYDFTKRVTAHMGYRFMRREITQHVVNSQIQTFFPGPTAALANRGTCSPASAHPLNPDGTCTVEVDAADVGDDFAQINTQTALVGFAARNDKFRILADAEFNWNDNQFFRISPRQTQDYRIRANYKPQDWVNLSGVIRILEGRNNALDIGALNHDRSYSFAASFAPAESRWSLDFDYDYNDIFSQINICFVATPNFAPPGAISCGSPFLSGNSIYTDTSNYASGAFTVKPWRRVTLGAGYAITSTVGNTLILNPNAPTGPLSFNYHLPTAQLAVEISKNLIYKAGWNYYDYNEKSAPGPTFPRDFRGNTFTLSLRYVM
jgi:hypothetical protein